MAKHKVQNEIAAPYTVDVAVDEEAIIAQALEILERRVKAGDAMTSPSAVKKYLAVRAAQYRHHEAFGVIFLNHQNKIIYTETLFEGTINQCSVYPRRIAEQALACGAAAIILTHNHPAGSTEPSAADIEVTKAITKALSLFDIRVLDHVITAGAHAISMAESGLL